MMGISPKPWRGSGWTVTSRFSKSSVSFINSGALKPVEVVLVLPDVASRSPFGGVHLADDILMTCP